MTTPTRVPGASAAKRKPVKNKPTKSGSAKSKGSNSRSAERGARAATAGALTISEENGLRYLHFGTRWVQGAMRIAQPFDIVVDYVEQMMAWLLLLEPPARVLQLGVGAGSLTKYTWRHLPDTATTAVDLSGDVIAAARTWFRLPPDDARLAVVEGDALAFVADPALTGRFGVIQVDLYDAAARGPTVDSEAFYHQCRRLLADPGVLVVNLFGHVASGERSVRRLRRVFDDRVVLQPPTSSGNVVVVALSGPALEVAWDVVLRRMLVVRDRYGIDARPMVRALMARARRHRNPVCAI